MLHYYNQCCGSGRFLTGSGSDFRKRPDPDPDPDPDHNKFSANFFLKISFDENMLKKVSSWSKKLNNIDSLSIYGFFTHQKS
jgi:hypothetical protein